jgi:hypothetical protein
VISRTKTLSLALAAAAALALCALAAAANVTATGTVTGAGSVTISAGATASFSDVLDGTDQTVTDGRGTGTGWTLRLNTPGATVTSITAACASNSTCTLPHAVGPATGASILATAQGTGMGVMNLVVTVSGQPKGPLAFSVVPR